MIDIQQILVLLSFLLVIEEDSQLLAAKP
ncbi:hypothetical protein AvCA_13310 [Azotobacter vinelandii CA]|uniref:Uncharacterized protein n=2 Tax=Azotobacter vinelandii TaxID=354 RepID=C1DQA5_AZOVD|nr:hypothetical protein Avin_13310 [Azotobacter vinelandii DJ]AGK15345.1 hypothetical protein AvCA_13310 [Azotobacter vinelandii CA]AGK19856.1 hypothetical protein AvCA6_13310 [Azotobacter vinelandii CA6]